MSSLKNIKKRGLVSFLISAITFGSIGTVVATNIESSSVNYTTNKNVSVATVEDALDDLYDQIIEHPITCYNSICGKVSYRYWNDGFSSTIYQSNSLPTNNYARRELLEQNYGSSNFASRPYYIRSILIDGTTVGHQVCLWQYNKEFCMRNKYWVGTIGTTDSYAGTQTKIKLKRDIQESLGVTIADNSCGSRNVDTGCNIGPFTCGADYLGEVSCNLDDAFCYVHGDGSAECKVW